MNRYPSDRRRRAKRPAWPVALALATAAVGTVWLERPTFDDRSPEERAAIEASVTYSGCNEVRAAGKAPIRAGEPGYREDMDGDGDGLACEPIRTNGL